jgi:hypothetical protein
MAQPRDMDSRGRGLWTKDWLRRWSRAVGAMAGETPPAICNRQSRVYNGSDGRAESSEMSQSFPESGDCPWLPRHQDRLERLRDELMKCCPAEVCVEMDAHKAVAAADLIITTTSAPDALLTVEELRSGSIVADVSLPKNISKAEHSRDDVTVVDGGRVKLPGKPEFSVDIGLSRGVVYACMAETMALALEGRLENFSLGDNISPAKVEEIGQIGRKHGFDVWLGESAVEIEEEG